MVPVGAYPNAFHDNLQAFQTRFFSARRYRSIRVPFQEQPWCIVLEQGGTCGERNVGSSARQRVVGNGPLKLPSARIAVSFLAPIRCSVVSSVFLVRCDVSVYFVRLVGCEPGMPDHAPLVKCCSQQRLHAHLLPPRAYNSSSWHASTFAC